MLAYTELFLSLHSEQNLQLMKKRILLLIVSTLFITVTSFAQDVPVGVVVALKKGNSQELCNYVSGNVELIILSSKSTADRITAESTLGGFFSQNQVKGFNVNHEGKRDESSFVIGTLTTANGNFRVNCFFKKTQNKYVIHQIRIDKANE